VSATLPRRCGRAYAHVPHGYDSDATEAITARIERFAPGFRDPVVGTSTE
jgi:phytoene dehydrogenase-like protein